MSPDSLASRIRGGERRALAQAITLVESSRDDHRAQADDLLTELAPVTGAGRRLGISGTPGVGKSTMIQALGEYLVEHGHRVAVLAIDPSSQRTGGSILGDKTRMGDLANHPDAYVRPSPSRGVLGGVADATRDAMLLCEAAGFDVVIVETVGVGQSETAVADITDLFLLLVAPGGGDDLQGIKRGVMEIADVLAVNKSDGAYLSASNQTAADYRMALHLMRPKWEGLPTEVVQCSAIKGTGIDTVWATVDRIWTTLHDDGRLAGLRQTQAVGAMWRQVNARIVAQARADTDRAARIEEAVAAGQLSPGGGARQLLADDAPR